MVRIAHRCECLVREQTTGRKKKCNRYGRAVLVKGIQHQVPMNMCAAHRHRETRNYAIEIVRERNLSKTARTRSLPKMRTAGTDEKSPSVQSLFT